MITPEQYNSATAAQLLDAYENAEIAFDHRLIRALLADIDGVAAWAAQNLDNDILNELLELFCHCLLYTSRFPRGGSFSSTTSWRCPG